MIEVKYTTTFTAGNVCQIKLTNFINPHT